MSAFGSLTVTMLSPHVIGELRIPHTHTVTVEEYSDWFAFEGLLHRAEESGYTFPSVIWTDVYGMTDELTATGAGIPNALKLSAFFDAVQQERERKEGVAAYVTEFGWFTTLDMDDVYYGHYDSARDFAMEYACGSQEHVVRFKGPFAYDKETVPVLSVIPKFLSIDWDDTAENLQNSGFTYVRFNGSTHVFIV